MSFNLISIIAGVVLAFVFEPQANLHALNFGERGLMGVSVGVLLGGLAQLCIQLPPLWRTGFKWSWTFNLSDAQLKQIWRLMLPSIVAGAAVQVNVLVNGIFASEINGARSWLNCAFRLMQFPIGVFGVAIATVTLPWVSRCRARGDHAGFGEAAGKSLRLAFFLTFPAALGLALIAPEVIQLIYEHGKFGAADTHATALALQAYAVGLAGYAAIKVLVPCFYALDRPSIPLRISLLGMGINLGLNLVFVKVCHWGHVGLALSTGGLAIVNFLQLFFALRRQVDLGRFREWLVFGAILSLMLVVCGLAVHNVRTVLHPAAAGDLWGQALRLCLMMAAGAGSYVLAGSILKVEECRWIWTLIAKIRSRPTRT
jgi:putative peptidoglycan lipid II flippase